MSNRRGQKKQPSSPPALSPEARRRIRANLLKWYGSEKRAFPWRGEKDPYRIWVSEAMLQQTRTDTVQGRYPAFIARFPTLASLADAPLEAVLAEWQGLGYYSRARNLHRAARIMAEHHGGKLPGDKKSLRALPGFGPYMAGAVSSIAFGERAPAVDGNAVRVLSRLIDLDEPADSATGKKIIEAEAEALVPPSRPGDFNQAVMDLSAAVCLPRAPRCHVCPIAKHCAAAHGGTAALRPVKTKKKPPREVTVFQLWAENKKSIRLVRREENGLFGGMWELPGLMAEGRPDGPDKRSFAALRRAALGPAWKTGEEIARLVRTLTHRKILFVVFRATSNGRTKKTPAGEDALWAGKEDLAALPISTAQRAVIDAVRGEESGGKQIRLPLK